MTRNDCLLYIDFHLHYKLKTDKEDYQQPVPNVAIQHTCHDYNNHHVHLYDLIYLLYGHSRRGQTDIWYGDILQQN